MASGNVYSSNRASRQVHPIGNPGRAEAEAGGIPNRSVRVIPPHSPLPSSPPSSLPSPRFILPPSPLAHSQARLFCSPSITFIILLLSRLALLPCASMTVNLAVVRPPPQDSRLCTGLAQPCELSSAYPGQRSLYKKTAASDLKSHFDVSLEVKEEGEEEDRDSLTSRQGTHHGPWLTTPSLFAEIGRMTISLLARPHTLMNSGSTESEWTRQDAAMHWVRARAGGRCFLNM